MTRCAVVLLVVLVAAPGYGQAVGAIVSGVVSDESGAPLPGVTITLTNVLNGWSQTLVSGERGEYRAVALPPAPYRMTAEATGFEQFQHDFTLAVGAGATVDVRLGIAGVREQVMVGPPPLAVDAGRHQPSSLVTDEQIRALPEIGRNFLVLAQLTPGSAPLNASVTRFASTKFGGVADQRSGFTTLVDGGDVDDAQWGSPTINLSQESVQEFKIFRYQFDAQYGNALGAVVSVVTRSGTNQFDGSALYFGRDEALNARNAFAEDKPRFAERRLGATAAGPLARNRSHLFGTLELDHVDSARIIAHPPSNLVAARENGVFPGSSADRLALVRIDHRFTPEHSVMVRYAYANQSFIRFVQFPSADSNQVDTFSRAHSVVAEHDAILSSGLVNAFRVHWFNHISGGVPHHASRPVAEDRNTFDLGLITGGEWIRFPRTELALSNTVYASRASHDIRLGGEISFGTNTLEGHFYEDGLFRFTTDAPFDPDVRATWPISFLQGRPGVQTYTAHPFALFVQDDWRVADRVRLNLGLRYDLDSALRINDFYAQALQDPGLAGLGAVVTGDRGTDADNLQPRVGAAFDLRGNGSVVLRGGWGVYVARNRPWFQVRSMDQLASNAVLVEDPDRLKLYPDVTAILAAGGARQLGTVIPDDFVQSDAMNTNAGVGLQLGRYGSIDVDYIHSRGARQHGTTDANLPATGRIGATNPRPLAQFGQVGVLENYTDSWYDALESQWRTRIGSVGQAHVSYTLSKTVLDGVDWFLNQRGTQRTPQERGYSPSDQRHNLAAAASLVLPGRWQLAGILRLVSGSPMLVQTGIDLDGDGSLTGDRPDGVPITVGRDTTDAIVRSINAFRESVGRPPFDESLLRLDPYRTLDLRLTKLFALGAARRLELLIEGFNVTNHVNYVPTIVVRNMNAPQFLRRNGARSARQIQWGARVVF